MVDRGMVIGRRKKIVVVEDDPVLSRLWERLLSELPCKEYKIFSSPVEAIEWLYHDPADILLTDLTMPQMSGLELMHQVENLNPETRMIATSGYVGDLKQFSDIDSFVHIIPKPYKSVDDLREFLLLFLEDAEEISGVELRDSNEGVHCWDL